ncbi:MAG: thiopurine S-methyltransferase [Boseongicola sp.]|nr:thiopurine S-methyltransferase [Boseongicola sp.]MDD9979035.1 thiopurine S-methyltransferase [Boseongicola sp.]
MKEEFWQERWRENRIGFHEAQPNDLLVAHFDRLGLVPGQTIFVPLCGKAFDLDWLRDRGLNVIGVEFNEDAVKEVFARLNLTPEVEPVGALKRYRADHLTLFVGDFFELSEDTLGTIHAIYDRAALVALPEDIRARYAAHLPKITRQAPQLVISFDYDQSQTAGPPFSVPNAEIARLYAGVYTVEPVLSRPIGGFLAERCEGAENVVELTP